MTFYRNIYCEIEDDDVSLEIDAIPFSTLAWGTHYKVDGYKCSEFGNCEYEKQCPFLDERKLSDLI